MVCKCGQRLGIKNTTGRCRSCVLTGNKHGAGRKNVVTLWFKGMIPWNKGKKMPPSLPGARKEEKNPCWKGDEVGYRALHHWVGRRLGKPSFCEECKRTKPPEGLGKTRSYFHWANISKSYRRDVKDWKRLCYKCHKIFDKRKK